MPKRKKKKSYKPFKMWGSWVGATIAVLMPPIVRVSWNLTNSYLIHLARIFSIVASGFVGFLIGWGIHSLIRGLKK